MEISLRLITTLLLPWILYGCAAVGTVDPADRQKIRRVAVKEKQSSISANFSLPTHPVSGAITGGLGGSVAGGLTFAVGSGVPCRDPSTGAAFAGTGGVIGGALGVWKGAVCGLALAEAEIEEPSAALNRSAESVEPGRFRRAIEERLRQLKPIAGDSLATLAPDTVLEILEVSIVLDQGKGKAGDSSSCPPGLSGNAKWRALRASDNELLGEVTTTLSQRTTSRSFKEWFRNEEAARTDIGLLLDEIGAAVVDELLTGKTRTP